MEQAIEDAIAALLRAWSDQGYSREDLEVEEEGRTITVNVPDDNDNAYLIGFDEFVEIIDELKSAKVDAERGYIRTKYRSYQVVLPVGYLAEMADYHEINIAVTTGNDITLSFEKGLHIVTFAAVSVGAHHEFYSPSTFSVISVTYPSPEDLLPEAEESKLIGPIAVRPQSSIVNEVRPNCWGRTHGQPERVSTLMGEGTNAGGPRHW